MVSDATCSCPELKWNSSITSSVNDVVAFAMLVGCGDVPVLKETSVKFFRNGNSPNIIVVSCSANVDGGVIVDFVGKSIDFGVIADASEPL